MSALRTPFFWSFLSTPFFDFTSAELQKMTKIDEKKTVYLERTPCTFNTSTYMWIIMVNGLKREIGRYLNVRIDKGIYLSPEIEPRSTYLNNLRANWGKSKTGCVKNDPIF